MPNLFSPGIIVATPTALALLERSGVLPLQLLVRHLSGDWGDLTMNDRVANQLAIRDGSRILSAYDLPIGGRIWIITDAEDDNGVRQSTCLLLPSEY